MPEIYLSPSTQDFHLFINGGNEEYYMNLIADVMILYLRASGIEFTRNNPGDSVSSTIERSNEGSYDLHLAIHSSATPEGCDEPQRGINVYHFAVSPVGGEVAAHIIAENLKYIYPKPNLVKVVPDYTLRELSLTNAPAVLVNLGYHDNIKDAMWIKQNIDSIARNLSLSVASFLHVPFREPQQLRLFTE